MPPSEYLEVAVDKFVFRVPRDRRYGETDVWAKREGDHVRVGLTDFLQQTSGDAASVDVRPEGTVTAAGDELAALETIKVDLIIPAPLAGTIVAVNPLLAHHPELVNTDPYGEGWLAELEPAAWADLDMLLTAEAYAPEMKARAELEQRK